MSGIFDSDAIKIVGADIGGNESAPIGATSASVPALFVNTRDNNGNEIGTATNPFSVNVSGFGSATSPTTNNGTITTTATTTVAVYKTTYTEQTTNAQRSIASASANDTAAGTGARTVKIIYYTATFTGPFTETVTLNGTTYVNTVATDICYIEEIMVVTAGSTGSNVGILTLKAATGGGGATIATVAATDNMTFFAHHYVATGKTCILGTFTANSNQTTIGNDTLFVIKSLDLSTANAAQMNISGLLRSFPQNSELIYTPFVPYRITGPAKVTVFALPQVSSSITSRASITFYDI